MDTILLWCSPFHNWTSYIVFKFDKSWTGFSIYLYWYLLRTCVNLLNLDVYHSILNKQYCELLFVFFLLFFSSFLLCFIRCNKLLLIEVTIISYNYNLPCNNNLRLSIHYLCCKYWSYKYQMTSHYLCQLWCN